MKNRVHLNEGRSHYDVVIVGSGVGGSMAAHVLIHAGLRVLMIERGRAVRRSDLNWEPDQALELSPHYTMESHYHLRGDDRGRVGTFQCVGGPSVFYGGVAFRMRETDLGDCPEVVRDSGAEWPYRYSDVEPYYGWAERILGVAGRDGRDATDAAAGGRVPPQGTRRRRAGPGSSGMPRPGSTSTLHIFRSPSIFRAEARTRPRAPVAVPVTDTPAPSVRKASPARPCCRSWSAEDSRSSRTPSLCVS